MQISYFNFDLLIFLSLLYVANPRVYLQEDNYIYSYGMVHFTCVSISSLVGRRVCSILYNYISMQSAQIIK